MSAERTARVGTVAWARAHGYEVCRGSYTGTADDRINGWYVDRDGELRDRSGPGYRTRSAALQALADQLGEA